LNGAEGWTPGERVAVGWFGGNCGTCLACREGDFIHCERLKIPGYSYPGGYSEAVVVPATALAPPALPARWRKPCTSRR
jgi:alcohol dehydrogenase